MTGVMKVGSNNRGGDGEVQRWQWVCASFASSPPSFGSPHPRSCLPALIHVSSPFTSPHPHSHHPALICISSALVVCCSPPRLHRGLLIVCRFCRSRCHSRCCCCCGCACARPRSKCPPGAYPAILCSPSLLAVIQVPVKE